LDFARRVIGHETQKVFELISYERTMLQNPDKAWLETCQHLSVINSIRVLDDVEKSGLQQTSD